MGPVGQAGNNFAGRRPFQEAWEKVLIRFALVSCNGERYWSAIRVLVDSRHAVSNRRGIWTKLDVELVASHGAWSASLDVKGSSLVRK